MKIIHYSEAEPRGYSGNLAKGTTGRVVVGQADGARNFCMRVFELSPGGITSKHSHPWEHEVFVHAGKGAIYSKGDWVPLSTGSVVFIPPDEEHQLKSGDDESLIFVCVIPSGFPEI